MKVDPFIPQQAETVEEAVAQSGREGNHWTGREMVAGADGVWHLMGHSKPRPGQHGYGTRCRRRVPVAHARTALEGEPTCPRCHR